MKSPILVTKLFIPTIRPNLVSRPRLIEQLDRGLYQNQTFGRKLTLISAPAGFGKTTLVTEWLQTLGENLKTRIAWLSLDEGDNDPTGFLTYLIAALNQADGQNSLGVGPLAMLQSPQRSPPEAVLTPLINEIISASYPLILVLDDYHMIENPAVHDALSFLLNNIPPKLHLVITTREDPLLPLPRLRARNQLAELRAADLRFSSAEAAEFLNRVMGLGLSEGDIAALETRTEGWIAGLQLAALSLQGQQDTSQLIQSFTGSHRLVLDYLIDEVLNQQSPTIQDFLLTTAILDRLTGPLCDAIRFDNGHPPEDHETGRLILEELERANLFIIPLDAERRWYRYHQLFSDLLRQRLRQVQPGQVSIFHSRASTWYEQHALLDEAIEHAFQARDFERSAALIAQLADALWKRGEHLKLRRWLRKLPDEWLCAQPQLCIYHAWFLFSTGNQAESENYLRDAEQAIAGKGALKRGGAASQPGSNDTPDRTLLEGRLNAIRALTTSWGKDFSAMIRYANLALEALPKQDPWRSLAELVLGDAYYYKGDMQASYQTRLKTSEACQAEDDLFFYMIAHLKVATCLREMGELGKTIEICQDQLEFAQQNGLMQTIFAGWAMGLLGVTLGEQNHLEKALELTSKYIEIAKGNDLGFVGSSYMFKTRVQFYAGDFKGAETTLRKLADIGQRNYLPHYISGTMKAWQARLYLAQNQPETARHLIAQRDSVADKDITLIYDDDVRVVYARLLLHQGDYSRASGLLAGLIEAAEVGGSTTRLIETLVLQALAKHGEGSMQLAMQHLGRALTLAEPGGYVRIFVDEGPSMAQLLYKALSQGIATGYIQRLLGAFPEFQPEQPEALEMQNPAGEWIEPLTERELEVLQLIAQGYTNPEIGKKLYLSLNTVKAHSRNIYGKLDVHNRTQAVAKSRVLGILSER
jgi:LuxR family maltose regulon positive regulatory protein